MIKQIFKIIVAIAAGIVIIDFFVAVVTNTEPYIGKLVVAIGLLLIGGVLCLVLLVRDTVFLDFGSASIDIQLLIEICIAFLVANAVDFISLFISIGQFPFVMIAEALDAIGGTASLLGITVIITSQLTFGVNIAGIGFDFTFFVEQLRFTIEFGIAGVAEFAFITSIFGGGELFHTYEIGYFSTGIVVDAIGTSSAAIFSLQAVITGAIESFLQTRTLEDVVKEVVARY